MSESTEQYLTKSQYSRKRSNEVKYRKAKVRKYSQPRSPFEQLRWSLNIPLTEWCRILEYSSVSRMLQIERGNVVAPVDIAKRIQHEAWKREIPITLDELYQMVEMHDGYRSVGSKSQQSSGGKRQQKIDKKVEDFRKQELQEAGIEIDEEDEVDEDEDKVDEYEYEIDEDEVDEEEIESEEEEEDE